jgi:hypothetical protein
MLPRKVKGEVKERVTYLDEIFRNQNLQESSKYKGKHTKDEIIEEIFRTHLLGNQSKIKRALTEFIVRNRIPFHMVENSSLGTLLACFNPCAELVLPTSHNTISKRILTTFKDQKNVVREVLKSAYTRIHLSADIWTSPNRLLTLGLNANFVRIEKEKPKRIRLLIGLQEVSGHSGDSQFQVITPILEEFDIVQNIGSVIGDNSGTNDTLCRSLASWFDFQKVAPEWDAQKMRARCLGHIINLIAKSFLAYKEIHEEKEEDLTWITVTAASYEISQAQPQRKKTNKNKNAQKQEQISVLVKLHGVVNHMSNSAQRTKEIRDLAGRLIPSDNATRWNSWYVMINVACAHHEAISKYILNHHNELEDKFLVDRDWKTLQEIRDFLDIFHEATLRAEGDHGSIGDTLILLNALRECVSEFVVSLPLFPLIFQN